eukprot:CAMPEP_0174868302 /NCGR_PEP_ID=MMETSP1114-20130205/65730_1 /TAXON_ID=312471 /ORGANISM="Neobodo designis, Strain CCAP 1951/1" /LENGTH=124 /DNA_ID=CAMNT_0016103517 /DNA_START=27 /DNA_END=398 /DNA_ORIENTATION=+
MIIYEVNIDVHPSIAQEYREWLAHHARGMFSLIEGLETAELSVRDGGVPCPPDYTEDDNDGGDCATRPADWVGYTAVYRIRTRAALDDYVANRSGPMRAEAISRFGTSKFRASRRIMESFDFAQ